MSKGKDTQTLLSTDQNAAPIQVLAVETTVNDTVTGTALGATALPDDTEVVMISTTEPVWIIFGGSGVSITSAQAGAVLVPGGGVNIRLRNDETHFNAIRAGSNNATLSVAKLY